MSKPKTATPGRSLALAALLAAAPAAAQTHLSDSTGIYLGLDRAHFKSDAHIAGAEVERTTAGLDFTVGYRFASGLDAGLRVGVGYLGGVTYVFDGTPQALSATGDLRLGPVLGYTRRLGARTGLRLEAAALYERTWGDVPPRARARTLAADGAASVYRPLRWRRLTLQPGVGLYAHARYIAEVPPELPAEAQDLSRTRAGAGLHLGLPLSLRVLGHRHLTLDPFLRYGYGTFSTPEARRYALAGLSLRFNF